MLIENLLDCDLNLANNYSFNLNLNFGFHSNALFNYASWKHNVGPRYKRGGSSIRIALCDTPGSKFVATPNPTCDQGSV